MLTFWERHAVFGKFLAQGDWSARILVSGMTRGRKWLWCDRPGGAAERGATGATLDVGRSSHGPFRIKILKIRASVPEPAAPNRCRGSVRLLSGSRPPAQARIEIGLPGGSLDAGLSGELCSAFGPKHAFTFDFPPRMSPHCGGAWARRGPGADGHHHPRTRRTARSPPPARPGTAR